jgi:hypothetical protein
MPAPTNVATIPSPIFLTPLEDAGEQRRAGDHRGLRLAGSGKQRDTLIQHVRHAWLLLGHARVHPVYQTRRVVNEREAVP